MWFVHLIDLICQTYETIKEKDKQIRGLSHPRQRLPDDYFKSDFEKRLNALDEEEKKQEAKPDTSEDK